MEDWRKKKKYLVHATIEVKKTHNFSIQILTQSIHCTFGGYLEYYDSNKKRPKRRKQLDLSRHENQQVSRQHRGKQDLWI